MVFEVNLGCRAHTQVMFQTVPDAILHVLQTTGISQSMMKKYVIDQGGAHVVNAKKVRLVCAPVCSQLRSVSSCQSIAYKCEVCTEVAPV